MAVISEVYISRDIFPRSGKKGSIFSIAIESCSRISLYEEIGARIRRIEVYIVVVDIFCGISSIAYYDITIAVYIPDAIFFACEYDRSTISSEDRIHISFETAEIPFISCEEAVCIFSDRSAEVGI